MVIELVIELKLQLLPCSAGGAKLQPSNQSWFPGNNHPTNFFQKLCH